MRRWLLAACLVAGSGVAAQAQNVRLPPPTRCDSEPVIDLLKEQQAKLRNGEPTTFELLSGAPAMWPMTTVSPRDAFLALPLDLAEGLDALPTDNRLWRPCRFLIFPEGRGRLYWEVEVVLGMPGRIERVEMLYRAPAPF